MLLQTYRKSRRNIFNLKVFHNKLYQNLQQNNSGGFSLDQITYKLLILSERFTSLAVFIAIFA